ncbi:TetR family transcriptional regulator [Chromohalobacter marismortui]|uniref:TetR family transcriptional regulator n=1 Tax=Chromohalobacter marismortui TaxID=42055 RepID=A0A4R7NQF5_9GAMM|nr:MULTISPECIES: TetR/AcrR family transcriptional regulator [Chromohalobacter]MCI0508696.1 TetR/AcrR family transcriptional regulator [Chromohalobacter sp.]MCI0593500.1 TetR/AcrR family transcriptional regulator [Chromohalobacter sp.]TDU23175.1 TetR family transcriptional regulator [Chromohalobacter marismortui]
MNKRDDVLNAALRLFNEHGYHAVGVDWIRDEAQVSKMTLYKYFPNKENLVEEVLKLRHSQFKDSLESEVFRHSEPLERLNAFINWHVAWFFSQDFHGCMFIKATGEFHDIESFLKVSQAHKDWVASLLTDLLSDAGVDYPSSLSQLFVVTIDGMIVNASIFHSLERIESAWNQLCKAASLPSLPLKTPSRSFVM